MGYSNQAHKICSKTVVQTTNVAIHKAIPVKMLLKSFCEESLNIVLEKNNIIQKHVEAITWTNGFLYGYQSLTLL